MFLNPTSRLPRKKLQCLQFELKISLCSIHIFFVHRIELYESVYKPFQNWFICTWNCIVFPLWLIKNTKLRVPLLLSRFYRKLALIMGVFLRITSQKWQPISQRLHNWIWKDFILLFLFTLFMLLTVVCKKIKISNDLAFGVFCILIIVFYSLCK